MLDWSSQRVVTQAFGMLLEQQQVPVDYVPAAARSQWHLLESGDVDVQLEVWQATMGEKFDSLQKRGVILEGVTHLAKTRKDWWFPEYVLKLCPGLPDWQALNGCAHLFSNNPKGKGRYYAGPWLKLDKARIRAFDLNFEVVNLPSQEMLNQTIHLYVKQKRPLLIYNWTPNWVEAVYSGRFVEFPDYEVECESEPSWGVNPFWTWDCGSPKNGWLKSVVTPNLEKKSACAFAMVRSFQLTNQEITLAATLVDVDHLSIEEAAAAWLELMPKKVETWQDHPACES